jgi:hypothetical protein
MFASWFTVFSDYSQLTDYLGRSLSTLSNTVLQINPQFPRAKAIKVCFSFYVSLSSLSLSLSLSSVSAFLHLTRAGVVGYAGLCVQHPTTDETHDAQEGVPGQLALLRRVARGSRRGSGKYSVSFLVQVTCLVYENGCCFPAFFLSTLCAEGILLSYRDDLSVRLARPVRVPGLPGAASADSRERCLELSQVLASHRLPERHLDVRLLLLLVSPSFPPPPPFTCLSLCSLQSCDAFPDTMSQVESPCGSEGSQRSVNCSSI